MYDYKVEYDTTKWEKCLTALGPEGMKELKKLMLGQIGEGIRGDIVKNKLRGQVLHRITGDLAASMYWQFVDENSIDIGNNMVYARIHELGGDIHHPGGTAFLTMFGKTIFVSNASRIADRLPRTAPHIIKMPARPYIGPTIQDWADSGRITGVVENVMDKKINELGAS